MLTTTNGTKLLHMVQDAAQIVTGAFLNLSALAQYLLQQGNNVVLGCAAWKDKFNLEDTVFAGALAKRLLAGGFTTTDDATRCAVYMDDQSAGNYANFLRDSSHYHRLAAYGLERDLVYCSTPDLHPVVPVLNAGRLVTGD